MKSIAIKKYTQEKVITSVIILANKGEMYHFKKHTYIICNQYEAYGGYIENFEKMQLPYISVLAKITTSSSPKRSIPIFMELRKMKQACMLVCYIMALQKEVTSFCAISSCNKHGSTGILAYLAPVMKIIKQAEMSIDIIHYFSNGFSTQYKQNSVIKLLITEIELYLD